MDYSNQNNLRYSSCTPLAGAMADDVKAKQTNGIAKEVSSSTDGAVEEPDSSPVSGNCSAYMSDEEGVSRNAEVQTAVTLELFV